MIHLSAWNAPFPTTTQMWLWRISAIILISSPLTLGLGLLGAYDDSRETTGRECASPFVLAFGIAVMFYAAARVFLVVECFIDLWYAESRP
jgi:hypothetical protein